MLYLSENDVEKIGVNWDDTIEVIRNAIKIQLNNDFSQPIKPYLRYKNIKNRIIAMPAYIGGNINSAGIKWIASFPENIKKGLPRANSVVVLNDAETGTINSIINTALISIIRTVSVSGFMIKEYEKNKKSNKYNVGIVGMGPIGQHHFKMCKAILGNKINKFLLYDKRPFEGILNIENEFEQKLEVCSNWQDVYNNSDIFICCTVTDEPYINTKPKAGALILNVSLRDFCVETFPFFKEHIFVDDWEEVCRENTTIDIWNRKYNLEKNQTYSITSLMKKSIFKNFSFEKPIIFCPMGMAIYDIAIAKFYYDRATTMGIGTELD